MKDTPFSLEIKKALVNFGGRKALYWNLADLNISDNSMTFQVCTKDFFGGITISRADDTYYCMTYVTKKEFETLGPIEFANVAQSRVKIVKINEIVAFIEKATQSLVGHPAPNSLGNIPQQA
jgi:hypothetical protein